MDTAVELLQKTSVTVMPGTFILVSLQHDAWLKLLEDPALSPRMTAPFLIFRDQHELTMLLDETDYGTMRHALRDTKVQRNFRLLTFETVMDFAVVGFLAEVSRILAEAGISIVAISAFSRDHILIAQDDLADALKALGPYVGDLC